MIVVDASVLAPALADDGAVGATARARLGNERLSAPELIDLETVSVLRGLTISGVLGIQRATQALAHLRQLPIRRVAHRELLPRCRELRNNLPRTTLPMSPSPKCSASAWSPPTRVWLEPPVRAVRSRR